MSVTSVSTTQSYAPAALPARGTVDSAVPANVADDVLPAQILYSPTRLSYDSEVRRVFFQYRDDQTGEVQREIPSRAALKLYEQQEAYREARGRQIDIADDEREAESQAASEENPRFQPRVIDGDSVSRQPSAPESTQTGERPSDERPADDDRGATTDQLV